MTTAKHVSWALIALFTGACSNQEESDLEARNDVDGKKTAYWFESFTLDDAADNSFIKYHQDNKDLLLGNRVPVLPDSLRGLWFMDGNPAGDQTLNLASVKAGRNASEDFYFEVNTPTTFSWTSIPESHEILGKIAAVNLTYSFQFLDCPADVKAEREAMWGLEDGSCTRADKEFAIITPIVTGPFGTITVPRSIAYFDMYLRPKTADFNIWERRSKVFQGLREVARRLTSIVYKDAKPQDFHRYKFTQVLDKDAAVLSSMSRLVDNVNKVAASKGAAQKDFLFYLCYDNAVGCSREAIKQGATIDPSQILEFGSIPML